jgi:hypothetical protein
MAIEHAHGGKHRLKHRFQYLGIRDCPHTQLKPFQRLEMVSSALRHFTGTAFSKIYLGSLLSKDV